MKQRLHVAIVGAAPASDAAGYYDAIIRGADVLISADGGLRTCLAAGRVPDVCVGDFDSVEDGLVREAEARGARIVRHPREKDASDLDLALQEARLLGATNLTFVAAFSDRIDHTMAAIGTLIEAADLRATADEPSFRMHAVEPAQGALVIHERPGTTLSVFAMQAAAIVTLRGVRYPLDGRRIDPLSSLGLSNVADTDEQEIRVHEGRALLVVVRQRT